MINQDPTPHRCRSSGLRLRSRAGCVEVRGLFRMSREELRNTSEGVVPGVVG
jgi:hypothetical protein